MRLVKLALALALAITALAAIPSAAGIAKAAVTQVAVHTGPSSAGVLELSATHGAVSALTKKGTAPALDIYGTMIKDTQTGRCLDNSTNTATWGNVYTNPCKITNDTRQRWDFIATAYNNDYWIYNVYTGFCLSFYPSSDFNSGYGFATYNNAREYCDTFSIIPDRTNYWILDQGTGFAGSPHGLCLDGNNAGQVYANNCQSGNRYQEWDPYFG